MIERASLFVRVAVRAVSLLHQPQQVARRSVNTMSVLGLPPLCAPPWHTSLWSHNLVVIDTQS
jgi:hypothetical protein